MGAHVRRVRRHRFHEGRALAVCWTARGYREVPLSMYAEAQVDGCVGSYCDLVMHGAQCMSMRRVR